MILARNERASDYLGIHPNLDAALRRITPEFLSSLGTDRVDILPGQVWCTKFTYETVPDSESFFEAHENFLDIHLMLEGCERVEIASPSCLQRFESKPENDFYAYHGAGQHKLVLAPGDFLVVWPDDAHKIKMMLTRPETVTKAVFKVKIHE
ncbi:MAG: YhcH/YjgK/YiaL family protein [Candidatus Faecousia sp.]|nr:YhcH/YjgK/YiaL family protein [Clostridiales bacterium]MDD5884116.1 YhcH/YjgK/YiaL family protein [Bacillota bacterium]MDY4599921.1 YhcH/YjgK/YiaL family protein [Candidatus Faecousia sp.]